MTDFEYSVLFVSFLEAANVVFANYMALVFAMLTASFFLARRMTWPMIIVLLFIYTLTSLNMGMGVYAAFADFSGIGMKVREAGQLPGSDLGWLGPVIAADARFLEHLEIAMAVMLVAGYLASIAFFFIVRFHDFEAAEARKQEQDAPHAPETEAYSDGAGV